MNKKIKFALVVVIVIAAVSSRASAEEDILEQAGGIIGVRSVVEAAPPQAVKILDGGDILSVNLGHSIKQIFTDSIEDATGNIKSAVSESVYFISLSIALGIASAFIRQPEKGAFSPITLCAAAAATSGAAKGFKTELTLCGDGIARLKEFSAVLMPSVAAASAASGRPSAGAATAFAALAATEIVIKIFSDILFPAVYFYVAAAVLSAVVENDFVAKAAAFIKTAVSFFMKWSLIVYTAYSGIAAVIGNTSDAAAVKTAKFAISGAIPVVGSIVSDAAGAVLSGAAVIKNAVGVFGLIAICSICAAPFLNAAIHYISYKFTAAVCTVSGEKSISVLIDGIGNGFGMALGMLGTVALLFFISVVLSIMVVSPI